MEVTIRNIAFQYTGDNSTEFVQNLNESTDIQYGPWQITSEENGILDLHFEDLSDYTVSSGDWAVVTRPGGPAGSSYNQGKAEFFTNELFELWFAPVT